MAGKAGTFVREKDVVMAFDFSTQTDKCSLYDREMKLVASCNAKVTQIIEKPGWCEHNPEVLMKHVYGLAKTCKKKALKKHKNISVKAIGITTQRETVIVWDKFTGKPLYNALVWRDTRTDDMINKMIEDSGGVNAYKKVTGLPFSNYISAVKIKWLMENIPKVEEKLKDGSAIVGTIDTWVVWNLTGGPGAGKVGGGEGGGGQSIGENAGDTSGADSSSGCHVTDVTNASRTYLMDINTCKWSAPMCEMFGIPMSCLPKICSSSEIYGYTKDEYLDEYLRNVPIAGIAGDQQAACVGHGMFSVGKSKCTYGTGAFVFLHTGEKRAITEDSLFCTPCYQLGKDQPVMFALEGAIKTAGAGVTYLKDIMKIIHNPRETIELFRSVKNDMSEKANEIIYVPNTRGSFAGENEGWYIKKNAKDFQLHRDRRYVIKALFEAIGFQLHEVIDKMTNALKADRIPSMYVDGGMTQNKEFLQFTANLMNSTVILPADKEVTCVGAAILAGLACKFWEGVEEVEKITGNRRTSVFHPNNHPSNIATDYDEYYGNSWGMPFFGNSNEISRMVLRFSSFSARTEKLALWKRTIFNEDGANWLPYESYYEARRNNDRIMVMNNNNNNNKHEFTDDCSSNISSTNSIIDNNKRSNNNLAIYQQNNTHVSTC